MALKIKCTKCDREFWIDGYATNDTWEEPGEIIVSDREDFAECCEHVQAEECYEVIEVENDGDPYDNVGWEGGYYDE